MPDSEPGAPAPQHLSRRDRRTARHQHRLRRVFTICASVLVVCAFAAVATETVRIGGGDRPTLAGAARVPRVVSSTPTPTTDAHRTCRSPLTDSDPLRLWVGGDSLAGSLGPSLGSIAGATGVVQPYFDSRVSSGLTTPTFFDWPKQATKEMARLNPEIVVFIIGANDYMAPETTPTTSATESATESGAGDGEPVVTTVPASAESSEPEPWRADYAARVETMLRLFSAPGRTVIWVGPPPFKDDKANEGIEKISEVEKQVVEQHHDALFVDDYHMFLDADGKYADKLPDENGNLVQMRTGDGVHFTDDGGKRLARAVYALVDAQCKVTAQAVPGVTKQTIQTEGSTQVAPGGSDRPGTVVTTPPATARPQTTTATAPVTAGTAPPVVTTAPPRPVTTPPPQPVTTAPPAPVTTAAPPTTTATTRPWQNPRH